MTKMSTPEHKTPRAVIHERKGFFKRFLIIHFITNMSTPNCTALEPLPRSDQTYKLIRKFFAIITVYSLCLLDSQEREEFKIENRYFTVFTKNIMWTLRWPKTALIFLYILLLHTACQCNNLFSFKDFNTNNKNNSLSGMKNAINDLERGWWDI